MKIRYLMLLSFFCLMSCKDSDLESKPEPFPQSKPKFVPKDCPIEMSERLNQGYKIVSETFADSLVPTIVACTDTSDRNKFLPYSQFLGAYMRTNESLIPNIKSGAKKSSKGMELYIESLWQCQTLACLELIKKRPFNLNQDFADHLLKEKPRIPSDYQIVSAAHLDAIWYVFLGSGEIKGPLHILRYLEQKFDTWGDEGQNMQEKLTYHSAMWSMRSFYTNDEKVKAMVDENCKHIELLAKLKS